MEKKRIFSADELAILDANGTPQERIEQGRLLPSEERLLDALAKAQMYLAQRYPQEEFRFTRIDYSTLSRTAITLFAFCVDTPQESFAVRVKGEKPPYEMSESHFSDIKRKEVNKLVRDALARMGVEAECDLEIPGLYGDAYDLNPPLEQLLEQGLEIPVSGSVYIAADAQIDADAIEAAVLAVGLSGGFGLYVLEGASPQEVLAMEHVDKHILRETYISLPVQKRKVR